MPIYEYHCESCDREVEAIVKTDDPPPLCPDDAGHGPMEKKISLAAFQLKGGGWERDGYGRTDNVAPPQAPLPVPVNFTTTIKK